MKKFRVNATMYTDLHLDVEANTAEEAIEIAINTDGGDFITEPTGDWIVGDALEIDIQPDLKND